MKRNAVILLAMLIVSCGTSAPEGLGIAIPDGVSLYGGGKIIAQTSVGEGATVVIHVDDDRGKVVDFYKAATRDLKVITPWNTAKQGMMGRGDWTVVELKDGRRLLVSIQEGKAPVQTAITWQRKEVMDELLKDGPANP